MQKRNPLMYKELRYTGWAHQDHNPTILLAVTCHGFIFYPFISLVLLANLG
jgi:hypothetical protein